MASWLQQRVGELRVFAEQLEWSDGDDGAYLQLQRFAEAHHSDFESVGLVSREGIVRVSDGNRIDIAGRNYFSRLKNGDREYTISKPVVSRTDASPIVVILVRADSKFVSGAVTLERLSEIAASVEVKGRSGWIVDGQGIVVAHPDPEKPMAMDLSESRENGYNGLEKAAESMAAGEAGTILYTDPQGKAYVLLHAPIKGTQGWSLAVDIPQQRFSEPAVSLLSAVLWSGLAVAAVSWLLALLFAASLAQPIRQIQGLMFRAERGDLSTRYRGERRDEIGQLGQSFNRMIDRVSSLLEVTRRQQQELKEAELRTMQAQIRPHFLYNTLDTMKWMAREYNADEIVSTVEALTRLFRISLSDGAEYISLQEELRQADSYLFIQKVRYEDLFDYQFCPNPEHNASSRTERSSLTDNGQTPLLSKPVMKLVLQPIVENALYHGIKAAGGGTIRICAEISGNQLLLQISDTGPGLPQSIMQLYGSDTPEELAPLPESEQGNSRQKGYGLWNVHRRLRLRYGAPYGIAAENTDTGARVTIIHPVLGECESDGSPSV